MVDRDTADLADLIRSYLRAHPAASDSLRGIRDWWLRDIRPAPDDARLLAALEALAEAGALSRIQNPDGTVLWTAGPELGR
ncbi:MAG TPA: hypothetical protein VJS15_10560 [Allosphingosinicella sp.]|nr:hypothetical protein [Allosphingosinicella sp.]